MPTDSRRIAGPESTLDPANFLRPSTEHDTSHYHKIVTAGTRSDGRKPDQIRPLFIKTGVISQAKGSAYLEVNQTKVICGVYGPKEVARREDFSMKGQLHCEFNFATFSGLKRRQHQADNLGKDISVILMDALQPAVCLEKYPKSVIDVFVTVLQNDGSALAAAITCSAVALADAEIEMFDVVIGCCCRQFGDSLLMDPTYSEEYRPEVKQNSENDSMITVGFMPSINQVPAVDMKGSSPMEFVKKAIETCIEKCHHVYAVVQKCLSDSVKSKLRENT